MKQLARLLKRRTSVNHLFQAACLIINPGVQATYERMLKVRFLDRNQFLNLC